MAKAAYLGIGLMVAVALCLCGCLFKPSDHDRPHGHQDTTIAISPTDDVILFNAAGTGGRDLYLLHLGDLKVQRVADTPDYEVDASFSPDGSRIVYAAGVPGDRGDRADHIFTMSRDGTAKTQLTDMDANDMSPQYSPDGAMVAFARDKTYSWGGLAANWNDGGVICVVAADGTGERQLTRDDTYAFKPLFSQDGKAVYYFTTDGLFAIPLDGSEGPKNIGPLVNKGDLSPNGKRFVYSHGNYSTDHELFIADTDGTNRAKITTSANGCFHAVFANTSDNVYFLVNEWPEGPTGVPKASIWTVRTDGTHQEQLTDLRLFDEPMNWETESAP